MIDYAFSNLRSFSDDPVNEVDCAILSWIVYLNIHEDFSNNFSKEGMQLTKEWQSEYFEEMFDKTWFPEDTRMLLGACAASPRFRDIRVKFYRSEINKEINLQFAAAVYTLPTGQNVVTYRGTDWSITGWKENLLLGLKNPTPAQIMSVEYLNQIAETCEGELIITGHSKGGNLAVFAAAHCTEETRERITEIYNFDGPGFWKSSLEDPVYQTITGRVKRISPPSSYFGALFDYEVPPRVVKSTELGVMQHSPLSWTIKDNAFEDESEMNKVASFVNTRLDAWMQTLSDEEIRVFISAMFDLLQDIGLESIDEITQDLKRWIPAILRSAKKMDKERREFVLYALNLILLKDTKLDDRKKIDISNLDRIESETFNDPEAYEKYFSIYIGKS